MAIPLYIVMSVIIQFSGLGSALYDMMYKWFGGLRGGLAIGTVTICTLMAAMTGLGGTAVVTMGVIALPEMLKRNYDKNMAVGCIPAGGSLGPLIPPSAPAITLAAFGNLSVAKLFIGGIVPGLIISLLFCVYIAIRCFLNPELAPALPPEERATWHEKLVSLRDVILPILLVIAVLGSIYTGAATPTEAGAVGAGGAALCALIYRRLTWKNLGEALIFALRVNGMVMWIMGGGVCVSAILSATGASPWIGGLLVGLPVAPIIVIILMQVTGLILGMFLDGATIKVITIPVFIPVVIALGFDPLWFGICFIVNTIIGYISPPFGMNLFYTKGIVPEGITLGDIYWAILPYLAIEVIVLFVCIAFPGMVLWLPKMMG
jgi:tripartite ATP-independent transporter DctM subunit